MQYTADLKGIVEIKEVNDPDTLSFYLQNGWEALAIASELDENNHAHFKYCIGRREIEEVPF